MLSFLKGGGIAGEAIRSHDWSHSPIGSPESWPTVLKTTVGLILGSRFPQCIAWGPSLVTIPNEAFLPILGTKPDALGRPFSEVWSEVWPSLEPIVAATFSGEATFLEDFPLTIERHGYPEDTYFTFCYSPIRDEQGHIVGLLDTVTETTDKVALHERQQVLAGELGHRLKNLLAIVQAVASQTLRQSADLATASETLAFRLAAFGRAADILTASEWADADLRAIVETTTATHAAVADRIHVEGPSVRFRSEVSVALSLVLHELTTNAVKYGALSNDDGHVEIKWSVDQGANGEGPRFLFRWREIGGPVVQPPTRRGFGSLMIERSLRGYLRGEAAIDYDPGGLVFTVDAPLAGAQSEGRNE